MAAPIHKICIICKEQKLFVEFYKDSRIKNGHVSKCKECLCAYSRNTYDSEKTHEYYVRVTKPKLQNNDKYRESIREKRHEYYVRVEKPKFQNDIKYRESVRERKRINKRNRYHNDPDFRLRIILRRRISRAIQSKNKSYDTLTLLGVENISEVKQHLEKEFTDNMNWDKSGSFVIDHIIPLSIFDLSDPVQQKVACHYTNLQPLTREDNATKAAKVPKGFNLDNYINTKRMELNI